MSGVDFLDKLLDGVTVEWIALGKVTDRAQCGVAQNGPDQPAIPDQKASVFQKISAFVEKFKGVGGSI